MQPYEQARLGPLTEAVAARLRALDEAGFVERLADKDPALWGADSPAQAVAAGRLGWLDCLPAMRGHLPELYALRDELSRSGYTRLLLLGMGGSSLCSEVLQRVFGPEHHGLDLRVLDSTDPATVASARDWLGREGGVRLVASKSGTTVEVKAFEEFFWGLSPKGEDFLAVTDPGTVLEEQARSRGYRSVFLNPADIGGRYSALSLFGLVPAALLGVDLDRVLDRAGLMARACGRGSPSAANPGVWLGVVMAEAALAGRDKMTLLYDPAVGALGAWTEQLVAESTGKQGGTAVLPVEGEALLPADAYGGDRLFLYTACEDEPDGFSALRRGGGRTEARLEELARAGHPVVRLHMDDAHDLGAEFYRWEVATATAASVLGLNAFDEPNVRESKELTASFLAGYRRDGALPQESPWCSFDGLAFHADPGLAGDGSAAPPAGLREALSSHLDRVRAGDYLALLAYLHADRATAAELAALRGTLAALPARPAVTLGYGPRYLHSTGQYHKGGPGNGVYLMLTCDDGLDLAIPGEPFGFSVLKQGQALGDFGALCAKDRRVLRCHLGADPVDGLRRLRAGVQAVVSG